MKMIMGSMTLLLLTTAVIGCGDGYSVCREFDMKTPCDREEAPSSSSN
ncbi:MAG: hypothetical protein OCC49_16010 [Fibrobacterales bacterium]